MTRRNQRLEHLLSPVQQRRLRQVWRAFTHELDRQPRDQARLNKLRAQLPPGGLRWPWWGFVLSSERTAQEVTTTAQPSATIPSPASPSQGAAT
jgi:hypothetical protein